MATVPAPGVRNPIANPSIDDITFDGSSWLPIYVKLINKLDGSNDDLDSFNSDTFTTTTTGHQGGAQQDERSQASIELSSILGRAATFCGASPEEREDVQDILKDVLETFRPLQTPTSLAAQILRFVGNACADCDSNRAIAIRFYDRFQDCLQCPGLQVLTFSVLFNISNDHKIAQYDFLRRGLHARAMECMQDDTEQTFSHSIMIDLIISLMTSQSESGEDEAELEAVLQECPMTKLQFIKQSVELLLTENLEVEEFASLLEFAACFLIQEELQTDMVKSDLPLKLIRLLKKHTQITKDAANLSDQEDQDEVMEPNRLELSTTRLMDVLCSLPTNEKVNATDITTSATYAMSSQLVQDKSSITLQTAGWLILGNFAMTDEICAAVMNQTRLAEVATRSLLSCQGKERELTREFVHAVTGFLRHLAISQTNRAALGNQRAIEAGMVCVNVVNIDPHVHQDIIECGLSLVVQLVSNCPENCERVLVPKSEDSEKDDDDYDDGDCELTNDATTDFNAVLNLYRCEMGHFDALIARFVALVYKGVYKHDDLSSTALLSTRNIASVLITQSLEEAPSHASAFVDTWFTIALMSTSEVGASLICECLTPRSQAIFLEQLEAHRIQKERPDLEVRTQVRRSGRSLAPGTDPLPKKMYPPASWEQFAARVKSLRAADGVTASLQPSLRTKVAQNGLLLTSKLLYFARIHDVGIPLEARRDLETVVRMAAINEQSADNGHPI